MKEKITFHNMVVELMYVNVFIISDTKIQVDSISMFSIQTGKPLLHSR